MDRVSAVYLLRSDGAALLQHRDDKPGLRHAAMWVPPGGHAEPGEDADSCARREMFEETEYLCGDMDHLHSLRDEHPGFEPYELTVFVARYDGQQEVRCHEGQALRFINREDATDFDVPAYLIDLWDMAIEAALGQREDE